MKREHKITLAVVFGAICLFVYAGVLYRQEVAKQAEKQAEKRAARMAKREERFYREQQMIQQADQERMQARLDVANQPVFGVFLGEPLSEVKARFNVRASTWSYTDRDHPAIVWDLEIENDAIKALRVSTFHGKVYCVAVWFIDTGEHNYRAMRDSLIEKYGEPVRGSRITGRIIGEVYWQVDLAGVPAGIKLEHNTVLSEDLLLKYNHRVLADAVLDAIDQAKRERVRDDI